MSDNARNFVEDVAPEVNAQKLEEEREAAIKRSEQSCTIAQWVAVIAIIAIGMLILGGLFSTTKNGLVMGLLDIAGLVVISVASWKAGVAIRNYYIKEQGNIYNEYGAKIANLKKRL